MARFGHPRWRWLVGAFVAALIAWPREPAESQDVPTFAAADVEFFQTKVRPLLEARCFECHGPDAKEPKGGLSLASRTTTLKGGDSGPAMVPGKPAESLLVKAINYIDFEMPPKSRLPEGEVAILTEWIKRGAPWSKQDAPVKEAKLEAFPLAERKASHWCWKPIGHFQPPNVAASIRDADSVTDIDRFILAKLTEKGLSPASPADRRALLRRVSFALIGLPPTPAEADDFVNDPAPTRDALARVVDRLLDSPHFGERWARHWLDLVRYAETLGHEFDYPLHHAYQYRDYVIRALNADVPYDRFVVEHVAGDLLPSRESRVESREQDQNAAVHPRLSSLVSRLHPTDKYNESLLATGFWFLGEDKHAPVDVKGEQAARIDNQLDVFSKTFLGLTVACARCHDHKFDPIRTTDYYALAGFLQSSRRQTAYLDPGGKIDAAVAEIQRRRAGRGSVASPVNPKVTDAPDARTPPDLASLSQYLLAADQVLHGTTQPDDKPDAAVRQRPDEVFEDFESDTFAKWQAEGSAFKIGTVAGTLPGQMPVSGFEGKRLLNSWAGSDDHTGKLTSSPFVIRHRFIQFLIGGGKHPGQTCFNLKVGGKIVQTATGKNNERLEPAAWDVSPWRDQEAVLEVVDSQTGGWGHINLDQIVFTDTGDAALLTKRPIAAVARESKLNAPVLEQVVRILQSEDVRQTTHPWWLWHEFTSRPLDPKPEAFDARKRELTQRLTAEQARSVELSMSSELFEDFSAVRFVDLQHPGPQPDRRQPAEKRWFATGWSFGDAPLDGVAHSAALSSKLRGVLRSPTFTITHPQILYRVAGKNARIRLVIDGYQMMDFSGLLFGGTTFEVNTDGKWIWHRQAADLQNYLGRRAYIELIDDGDGWIACDEIRFTNGGPDPAPMPHSDHARLLADPSIKSPQDLAAWIVGQVSHLPTANAAILGPVDNLPQDIPDPLRAIAICDGNAIDEHVFIRGSHKNLGPEVSRRNLEALDGIDQPIVDHELGSGRLQLAMRLIDARSNPFVPRVAVNRVWHHLFGRGLVETVDNFGVLGQKPTHPELLDHLAETFVADGWSLKRLIRRIVLTNTWQMASESDSVPRPSGSGANANEVDPQNLLLHHFPIQRLEGEAIRDAMLLVAGRLDRKAFGPSVPVHLTPFMQGRGRPGTSGPLDGDGRRSLYTSVNRNFLSPMMLAFDTPIPFTAIGRRNVSNVPAQALILLNDPFVLDMAKRWAERSLKEQPDVSPEARIERLYLAAFTRSPSESERADALAFLQAQAKSANLPADAWPKHALVWTDLCHVLFNVKEFVFVK
jgi:mono/diheme cytochrome c family protein